MDDQHALVCWDCWIERFEIYVAYSGYLAWLRRHSQGPDGVCHNRTTPCILDTGSALSGRLEAGKPHAAILMRQRC